MRLHSIVERIGMTAYRYLSMPPAGHIAVQLDGIDRPAGDLLRQRSDVQREPPASGSRCRGRDSDSDSDAGWARTVHRASPGS